ncbi:MAG TPA: cupin domain-containing protein [Caldithrix sp.]|nr:cupin domain-containing protein [Syntrophaceae bacterium]HEM49183.1 cupin domain-containing protein [Caldithrix sp.]
MQTHKTAPDFAKKFRTILEKNRKTQRQIAVEFDISTSAINRLCKEGIGTENHICAILTKFNLKRRRIIELLTDRRAELCDGPAREIWKNFRYAFLDEDEYLKELSPFPLDRAYASTHLGIHIRDVLSLAEQCGIDNISESDEIDLQKFMGFINAFEDKYGTDARKAVFASKCSAFPPVLLMDFSKAVDVADYIKIDGCVGQALFGLPHMVLCNYAFEKGGSIGPHRNSGGIEFLWSLSGTFELTYSNITYAVKLNPGSSLYVLDARKRHAIKLIGGDSGRLLMVRFYPQHRDVKPGKAMRRVRKRHEQSATEFANDIIS